MHLTTQLHECYCISVTIHVYKAMNLQHEQHCPMLLVKYIEPDDFVPCAFIRQTVSLTASFLVIYHQYLISSMVIVDHTESTCLTP